jgi:hypothetical protein
LDSIKRYVLAIISVTANAFQIVWIRFSITLESPRSHCTLALKSMHTSDHLRFKCCAVTLRLLCSRFESACNYYEFVLQSIFKRQSSRLSYGDLRVYFAFPAKSIEPAVDRLVTFVLWSLIKRFVIVCIRLTIVYSCFAIDLILPCDRLAIALHAHSNHIAIAPIALICFWSLRKWSMFD